jgi:hypothetical protein
MKYVESRFRVLRRSDNQMTTMAIFVGCVHGVQVMKQIKEVRRRELEASGLRHSEPFNAVYQYNPLHMIVSIVISTSSVMLFLKK